MQLPKILRFHALPAVRLNAKIKALFLYESWQIGSCIFKMREI